MCSSYHPPTNFTTNFHPTPTKNPKKLMYQFSSFILICVQSIVKPWLLEIFTTFFSLVLICVHIILSNLNSWKALVWVPFPCPKLCAYSCQTFIMGNLGPFLLSSCVCVFFSNPNYWINLLHIFFPCFLIVRILFNPIFEKMIIMSLSLVFIYVHTFLLFSIVSIFLNFHENFPPNGWKHIIIDFYGNQNDNFYELIKSFLIQFKCI
jgi:hypothetical protein